ncbi:hypothetical protein A9Q81_00740 [Gammaproteobacteria bacterium 42_54_T18]|nr:hypothetical protein A9Q81_00740 [Gammaproteobacteria bacterium 42_54_T18]
MTCTSVIADEREALVRSLESGRYELGTSLRILEDKTGELTIDQIISVEDERFVSHTEGIANLGITPHTYWLEISIGGIEGARKEAVVDDEWYLEIGRALLDVAELYVPDSKGGYEVQTADTRAPFSEREVYHVNSVFPVTINLNEHTTLYFKVKHPSVSLYLPVTLWKPEVFVQKVAVEEFFYGFFYGSIVVLIFYNFFIYLTVRDVSYIYYVGYLMISTTFLLFHSGHGVLHAPYVYDFFTVKSVPAILWFLYMTVILFMQSFLDIKYKHPMINRVVNVFVLICFLNILLCLYIHGSFVVKFAGAAPLFLAPFVIFVGCYSWKKGNENGKFYVLSWLPLIVGTLFNSVVFLGFFALNAMSEVLLPLSIMLEATILSFALANRIKISQELVLYSKKEKFNNLKKYKSIFNNSLQGLYRMTIDGRVVSANETFIKIFGFSRMSQVKNNNVDVLKSIFVGGVSDYHVLRGGEVIDKSIIIPADGGELYMEHSAKMVFDESGLPSHVEGSLTDNTDLYSKLMAISERERERVKNDIAQQVMDTANQYLSMMSHHIRTPLTSIIGYGELLKDADDGVSQRREWVEIVERNSHSLLKLINDILDYSKIDAEKMDIENIEVDVNDIVFGINSEFSKKSKNAGLTFDVSCQLPIPSKIIGDPTRIVQVLNNLCDNAIKFTREGGVIMSLDWDNRVEQITFSITDTGIGISRTKQKYLFDMFSHGDGKYSDAGLGLVLSKKLALLMGGDITVESKVGKGSEFTLIVGSGLPADVDWMNKNPLDKKQNIDKEEKVSPARTLNGTVLLAEDNVVNQKLIERVLKKTGVTVVIANDGLEACEYCDSTVPDFILMDINMPNRSGMEATKYLRDKGYVMPIFALTAETEKEEIDKMMIAGCQGFLEKPLNFQKLRSVLNQYLAIAGGAVRR